MKDVKVYAQNLRSYNMGLDQGRWITLGIEEQELQRILTEQLHLTEHHPDMAIFDYQADFEISEYEDIYELNQAVAQLKQLPEQDYEKVMDYCDARDITSPLEISNVCLQADEVPYERFPDWIDENVKDPEEKLGYALFENNSLAPEIKAAGMEGYFDYKAYGRDEAINSYDIGDHGFVNKRISIDVEKYSYEEIQNQLKENGLDESTEYKEENTWESEENFWSDEATYEQETYMASDNEIMVEKLQWIINEKGDQEFSINKIGDELFGKNPQKKMEFDEKMERYNMQYDKFTVEKEETIKDLGYIKLRTNNEIEIKIPMEEYQTKECIKVEEEPDGTKTIVMKNIEQVTVE